MDASEKTPPSQPDCCPACGAVVTVAPPNPEGDVPCPQCGKLLWFVQRSVGEVVVLTFLPGRIAVSEGLTRVGEVAAAIATSRKAVVKLTYLPFVSSTFLNMLITLRRQMRPSGGTLRLCGLHPDIHKVLKITKIDCLFGIYDDEQAAMAG